MSQTTTTVEIDTPAAVAVVRDSAAGVLTVTVNRPDGPPDLLTFDRVVSAVADFGTRLTLTVTRSGPPEPVTPPAEPLISVAASQTCGGFISVGFGPGVGGGPATGHHIESSTDGTTWTVRVPNAQPYESYDVPATGLTHFRAVATGPGGSTTGGTGAAEPSPACG